MKTKTGILILLSLINISIASGAASDPIFESRIITIRPDKQPGKLNYAEGRRSFTIKELENLGKIYKPLIVLGPNVFGDFSAAILKNKGDQLIAKRVIEKLKPHSVPLSVIQKASTYYPGQESMLHFVREKQSHGPVLILTKSDESPIDKLKLLGFDFTGRVIATAGGDIGDALIRYITEHSIQSRYLIFIDDQYENIVQVARSTIRLKPDICYDGIEYPLARQVNEGLPFDRERLMWQIWNYLRRGDGIWEKDVNVRFAPLPENLKQFVLEIGSNPALHFEEKSTIIELSLENRKPMPESIFGLSGRFDPSLSFGWTTRLFLDGKEIGSWYKVTLEGIKAQSRAINTWFVVDWESLFSTKAIIIKSELENDGDEELHREPTSLRDLEKRQVKMMLRANRARLGDLYSRAIKKAMGSDDQVCEFLNYERAKTGLFIFVKGSTENIRQKFNLLELNYDEFRYTLLREKQKVDGIINVGNGDSVDAFRQFVGSFIVQRRMYPQQIVYIGKSEPELDNIFMEIRKINYMTGKTIKFVGIVGPNEEKEPEMEYVGLKRGIIARQLLTFRKTGVWRHDHRIAQQMLWENYDKYKKSPEYKKELAESTANLRTPDLVGRDHPIYWNPRNKFGNYIVTEEEERIDIVLKELMKAEGDKGLIELEIEKAFFGLDQDFFPLLRTKCRIEMRKLHKSYDERKTEVLRIIRGFRDSLITNLLVRNSEGWREYAMPKNLIEQYCQMMFDCRHLYRYQYELWQEDERLSEEDEHEIEELKSYNYVPPAQSSSSPVPDVAENLDETSLPQEDIDRKEEQKKLPTDNSSRGLHQNSSSTPVPDVVANLRESSAPQEVQKETKKEEPQQEDIDHEEEQKELPTDNSARGFHQNPSSTPVPAVVADSDESLSLRNDQKEIDAQSVRMNTEKGSDDDFSETCSQILN